MSNFSVLGEVNSAILMIILSMTKDRQRYTLNKRQSLQQVVLGKTGQLPKIIN